MMKNIRKITSIALIASLLVGCIPPGMVKPSGSQQKTTTAKPKWGEHVATAPKESFYLEDRLGRLGTTPKQASAINGWESVSAKYANLKSLNTTQTIELGKAITPLLIEADKEWLALNPSNREREIVGRLTEREKEVDADILPLYKAMVKARALSPDSEDSIGFNESKTSRILKESLLAIRLGAADESYIKNLNAEHFKMMDEAYPNGSKVLNSYLKDSYTYGGKNYANAQAKGAVIKNSWNDAKVDALNDFGTSYCDAVLMSKDRNHYEGGVMGRSLQDVAAFLKDKTIAGTSASAASARLAALLKGNDFKSKLVQDLIKSTPVIGVALSVYELSSGHNVFTGEPLSPSERVLGLASCVPGVGALGSSLRLAERAPLVRNAFARAQSSGKYVNVASAAFSDSVEGALGEYSPKTMVDNFYLKQVKLALN